MRRIALLLSLQLCLAATAAHGAHTAVRLVLSADAAKPGDTIWAGLDLKMDPGWHTYWKNPGEAGMATEIKWQLPPGVSAGEIQWPLPKKILPTEITTYGYEDEVLLLVPLKLAGNYLTNTGPLELQAKVSWLECKEVCVPASALVQAHFNVAPETALSADDTLIQSWLAKVPKSSQGNVSMVWENASGTNARSLRITSSFSWMLPATSQTPALAKPDFYPYASDQFEIDDLTESPVPDRPDGFSFHATVRKYSGDWPKSISGVLVADIDGRRTGFAVESPVEEGPNSDAAGLTVGSAVSPALPSPPLWRMLLYAFIGGLILNIMPCVLPVIALKILGFVGEARSKPHRVRRLGLVYAAGVIVSFLALAALVISVKAAGHKAGWGMQFGSPVFLVGLTTLVLLVALNLFGVFEVVLGGRVLDSAGGLAARRGLAGAFFNGILATTLATPCTAPFLAPALGFAFAQTAPIILLVFSVVGLGLAAPYVLLSCQPAWLSFLPKPGAWMDQFKRAMGFPMLLTAVWLFNLAAANYDHGVLWLGLFLVGIGFAAWIFGEFVQRGRHGQRIALAVVAAVIAGDGYLILEKQLDWRQPAAESLAADLKNSPDGIAWQPWTPAAVTTARLAGQVVLVDFTADWCLTCQLNKRTSLEIPSVRAKLKELHAAALAGDYTHFPDSISTELSHFQRAGVPLVLVYPKNASTPPIVLPEVLTPGLVLDALDRAAQ